MELNYKDMLKALVAIEDERKIPLDVVVDALKEALAKAYKKEAELNDINVEVEIDDKTGHIQIYQCYTVVDTVEDGELEISLAEAQEENKDAKVGDTVRREVEIQSMGRAAATLARNVMRQKIREAEKVTVYNEYIDQLHEMVLGIVESVKDKFTLVNLGKTVAMMPKSAEIPGERLSEGQKLRVVITEVNKDTKGSQVLVSRADPMLVKRLFENEVPEIFQGIVEIKAIAREAGERTKMAVMSHNEEVDPIGACIGPRGSRVQEIIEELHGEKIDIFQWSDDITQLVKNALSPAEVMAVLPSDDEKSLLVIVAEDQLSLAIGKKGKNARLAVKLTDRKIDIKTKSELAEMGKDYDQLVAEAEVKKEQLRKEREKAEIAKMEAAAKEAEEKRRKAAELLQAQKTTEEPEAEPEETIPEEMQEVMQTRIQEEMTAKPAEKPQEESKPQPLQTAAAAAPAAPAEQAAVAAPEAEAAVKQEQPAAPTPAAAAKPKKKKINLEDMKSEYVSVFEKLANTTTKPKAKPIDKLKKKKRKGEEEEIKTRNKDLEKQISPNLKETIKPVYTEEELAEIQKQEQEEEEKKYDINYDEFEDYYKDDEEK